MTGPAAAALRLREWRHDRRFTRALARPDRAQAAVLRAILDRHAGTAFARAHGLGRVRTPGEYARAVPIRDFEGLRPYVTRVVAGEPGVLTADPVVAFATTSGTTAEPKLVPVTAAWRASLAALTRLWLLQACRAHPGVLDGRALTIVSPAVEATTPSGVPVGAMSGLLQRGLPPLVARRSAVPYEVCLVRDWEARYFLTMRIALATPVSVIATANPTTLWRLAEIVGARAEALVRAIHDGTLGIPDPPMRDEPGCPGPEALRRLRAALRPDPARARRLATLAVRAGGLRPRDCWPGLALIGCWLGGSAGGHAGRLGAVYGGAPRRDLGLVASEGRITLPLDDDTAAGPLAVHAGFYEFVPEEAIEHPVPPVRLAHELEDGHRYYVVLTGDNGLYRYDLNDIVEVQGFAGRTPRLAFVRKGRDAVSITGEKLCASHVEGAVRVAAARAAVDVWQLQLIPDPLGCRYDLLVEPARPPGRAAAARFLRGVDEALAAGNREYADKRASGRLAAPRLHVMRPGWAERRCRADFARGRRDAQHKWPVIRLTWDEASRGEVDWMLEDPGRPPAPLGAASVLSGAP
jgi:hypothetical protein